MQVGARALPGRALSIGQPIEIGEAESEPDVRDCVSDSLISCHAIELRTTLLAVVTLYLPAPGVGKRDGGGLGCRAAAWICTSVDAKQAMIVVVSAFVSLGARAAFQPLMNVARQYCES